MNVSDDQTVGQSLTLECRIYIIKGVNSEVDIIWQSNGLQLESNENVSANTAMNNSEVYISTFTVLQLSTTDEGKIYQCGVVINTISPIIAYDNVTLNVTGKT